MAHGDDSNKPRADGGIPFELFKPANDTYAPKPTAKAVRVAAGRRARAAGVDLERYLAGHHKTDALDAHPVIADVHKIEAKVEYERVRCQCGRSSLTLQWADKACADFLGALNDGRPLVIEAKSVEGPDGGTLYRSDVLPQQAAQLDTYVRIGGLAVLVVEFRRTSMLLMQSTICAIRWDEVPWQTLRSAESLSLALARPWAVKASGIYLAPLLK